MAQIRAVASPAGRARYGATSIEGTRLLERALGAGVRVHGAIACDGFLADPSERTAALRAQLDACDAAPVCVPDEVFAELTDGRELGGVLALAELPRVLGLESVLAGSTSAPAKLLACLSVFDPGNVGALVRTAHASGAAAFLAVGATDAFHPRAVRTSMGSVFRLPVLTWADLGAMTTDLRAAGVRTVGAVTQDGVTLSELAPSLLPTAVVFGSEAHGLQEHERARMDVLASLPMPSGVDSFSINAAAAIFLYALGRP